jgi:hypothetical protein
MNKVDDGTFIAAWNKCGGSPTAIAKLLGISERRIYTRRNSLANRGIVLPTRKTYNNGGSPWAVSAHAYKTRNFDTIKNSHLVVFSDAHYWPGEISLAHEALIKIVKLLKPAVICANGDVFDGARISRHEPMGWQKLPTVIEELDTCKARLGEVERASPDSRRYFTVGNHDSRFDRRLATEVAEFEDVPGMSLEHHIGNMWPMSYTLMINEDTDPVFVLHNIKGGIHAPFNNIKAAGCTVITGHLHSQKTMPFTTLFKTWEGIDAGCLADVQSPAFAYGMDRPADHRSGFVVIRFDDLGIAYPADLCRVQYLKNKQRAVFRGEIVCERSF